LGRSRGKIREYWVQIVVFLVISFGCILPYIFGYLNAGWDAELFNDIDGYLTPNHDETLLYLPRAPHISLTNPIVGDVNLKEDFHRIYNLNEAIPNIAYGILYHIFGLDGMFIASKYLFCFISLLILFGIFMLLTRNRAFSTAFSLITLFESSIIFKVPSAFRVDSLGELVVLFAPINTYAFRLYQMSFSIIFVLIFLYLLIRFVKERDTQDLFYLTILAGVNVYVYAFNWMALSAIVGMIHLWHIYENRKKRWIARETAKSVLAYCMAIFPYFYVALTYSEVSIKRFGTLSTHFSVTNLNAILVYGPVILFIIAFSLIFKLRKKMDKRVHNTFLMMIILMFVLVNINIHILAFAVLYLIIHVSIYEC